MSIKITGDSIEFVGTLEDFKTELSRKFSERKGAAKELAEEQKVAIKTLYNWAHKYDTFRPMQKRNYTTLQKMKLILKYDSLEESQIGEFLRQEGLKDEQIFLWKKEVEEMEEPLVDAKAEARQVRKDLKRVRKNYEQKKRELRKKDKELKEAKAIINLKKKAEIMFGKKDEE